MTIREGVGAERLARGVLPCHLAAMLSKRPPIFAGIAAIMGMGAAASYIGGSFIEGTAPDQWLDNTIVACLPSVLLGIIVASAGVWLAERWPGASRGFVLVDIEYGLRWAALPLCVAFYLSRPTFVIGCAILWGAFFFVRGAMTQERGRLNNAQG